MALRREPKLCSIVRSEKLIPLVKTLGLFCGDTCFQMCLGSNSFCYKDFLMYFVSDTYFRIAQIYSLHEIYLKTLFM